MLKEVEYLSNHQCGRAEIQSEVYLTLPCLTRWVFSPLSSSCLIISFSSVAQSCPTVCDPMNCIKGLEGASGILCLLWGFWVKASLKKQWEKQSKSRASMLTCCGDLVDSAGVRSVARRPSLLADPECCPIFKRLFQSLHESGPNIRRNCFQTSSLINMPLRSNLALISSLNCITVHFWFWSGSQKARCDLHEHSRCWLYVYNWGMRQESPGKLAPGSKSPHSWLVAFADFLGVDPPTTAKVKGNFLSV